MNIFQIEQNLLSLFDEIEDNGGELTEELEQQLSITEEEFKDKIEKYTNVIKLIENDLSSIKEEQARLKQLYDRKEKTVNKLKEIIIEAVNTFGETNKSGVKFYDYGTGKVSIRKTEAVEVNDNLVDYVKNYLGCIITWNKQCNQLDVTDNIPLSNIITDISQNTDMGVSADDLKHIDVKFEVSVPLQDISNGTGYTVLKEIAKYSDDYKLSTSVSKSAIKPELKENGSCMPNLAKLVQNKSLIIK